MTASKKKIHIIANCANRKRKAPVARLGVFPFANQEARVNDWWEFLDFQADISSPILFGKCSTTAAIDLYIGAYWSTIRSLPEVAGKSGMEADLWVVSAGYGLIPATAELVPYSATFARYDNDSVFGFDHGNDDRKCSKEWWRLLAERHLEQNGSPRRISDLIKQNSGDFFLFTVSHDYLEAIEDDLIEGIESLPSKNDLLVITSKTYSNLKLEEFTLVSDARLQCDSLCLVDCNKHLLRKGIRGTIGARLTEFLIRYSADFELNSSKMRDFVHSKIETSPDLMTFSRARLNDADVKEFIQKELKHDQHVSCTFLLRKLRTIGQACEQKRFGKLYKEVKGDI